MTRPRNQQHASHRPAQPPRLGAYTETNVQANRAAMGTLARVLGKSIKRRAKP